MSMRRSGYGQDRNILGNIRRTSLDPPSSSRIDRDAGLFVQYLYIWWNNWQHVGKSETRRYLRGVSRWTVEVLPQKVRSKRAPQCCETAPPGIGGAVATSRVLYREADLGASQHRLVIFDRRFLGVKLGGGIHPHCAHTSFSGAEGEMRYYQTVVEQLDRAASELATDHPINNRLALILIDNATELIVHRLCKHHLAKDEMFRGLLKAHQSEYVMTENQRIKANGKDLKGKLKVLGLMGDLNLKERKFISHAHSYRNELYHVGLAHDEIIRAIAGQYYLFCCDLFARTGNASVWRCSVSSNDKYTEDVRRYFPMRGGQIDISNVDDEIIAEKLRCALPAKMPNLAETLSESAQLSIGAIMDGFEFLTEDNPRGLDKDEILELVQWQRDLANALECAKVDGHWADPAYLSEYLREERKLKATWKQRHNSVPHDKWRSRAQAVGGETDPLVAMELYQSLRHDMSYLEEAIDSAANELDRWIQMEIDRMRGK